MLARTFSASISGLQTIPIEVEVDGNRGTPAFIFVGLPSKATGEAKERITSALQNCGIRLRSKRTIVNLAPADVPKTGASFDLAIAVALLKMYGELNHFTDHTMFFGELALDGQIKAIRGALPLVLLARQLGFHHVILPTSNIREASLISGIELHPIRHIQEYLRAAQDKQPLFTYKTQPYQPSPPQSEVDMAQIYGQEQAKRALLIAAAGNHHIVLTGVPGVGKTMLAHALISLLPPLTEQEAIEVTRIYSLSSLTTENLLQMRPFRAPHHTISQVKLLGGGLPPQPGEVSLAHRGVLFLDELLEFPRPIVETLRQPLETGTVQLPTVAQFPAEFLLIGATNPCPCGYATSTQKACHCSPHAIEVYRRKLSGPFLDRIDLHVTMREVRPEDTAPQTPTTSAAQLREMVLAARTRQLARLQSTSLTTNGQLRSLEIKQVCHLSSDAHSLLTQASQKLQLSARGYFSTIRVAQTIADLAGAAQIEQEHLAEALQYREVE